MDTSSEVDRLVPAPSQRSLVSDNENDIEIPGKSSGVGLYIAGLDTTGWSKPDGRPVGDYWRITRGSRGAIVRARYEVPRREGFVVGQVQIGGEPIEYGGQIAERITMKLTGLAAEQGRHRASPVGCRRRAPAPASEPGLAGAEIGLRRPHG